MRVCNHCDNTGSVNAHNWKTGKQEQRACSNCHEASSEEIKAAFNRAVEAAKQRADEDRKDSIRDEELSRNRKDDR